MYKSIVATLLFLVCLVAVAVLIFLHHKHDHSKWPQDYAIVFDAGSSGSRMYVYQWRAGFSAARGDPLVITEAISCRTTDNGLDKIKSQSELVDRYSACVAKAQEKIPQDRKKRTYLFLAATAGMRLLEARNKSASDQIFSYVRNYFRTLGFKFNNDSQARIITGQEEGADAWISANYFENNFVGQPSVAGGLPETKGILDLGGASTQIVFVPRNPNLSHKEYFTDIRILGKTYRPYSHSFLCWGLKEATQLYQTYLIVKNNYRSQSPLAASCFPVDTTLDLTAEQIADSPCANGLLFVNNTPPLNFTVDMSRIQSSSPSQNSNNNKRYVFSGLSSARECAAEVEVVLPRTKCDFSSTGSKCSFYNTYQPEIEDVKFLGFSSFFFSRMNTEKLLNETYDSDLDKFKRATDHICSRSYPELAQMNQANKAGLNEAHLRLLCFNNMYSIALTSRYGFADYKNFRATDKINGFSLNWALGYLINELNRDDFLPYEEPPRLIGFSLFLTLVLLVGFVGSWFLIYVLHRKIPLPYKNEPIPRDDPEEGVPITIKAGAQTTKEI